MATTLEILQHYLTAGIEMQTPKGRAKLLGLNSGFFQCPVEIELVEDECAGHILSNRYNFDYNEVTPVLRCFSQLTEPLEDGTVPLYEYVRFMWPNERDMRHKDYGNIIEVWGSTALYMMKRKDFEEGSLHRLGSIYLQKLHFAIGLTESQYIPKSSGAPAIEKGTDAL